MTGISAFRPSASVPTELRVSEGVLFWAFRYALGRMTYAVDEVAETIIGNAALLPARTRDQIVFEIGEARRKGNLGLPIDALSWEAVERAIKATTPAETDAVGTKPKASEP